MIFLKKKKQELIIHKDKLELEVINTQDRSNNLDAIIIKLGNLSSIKVVSTKPTSAFSFMVKSNEFFIPINNDIDISAEIEKLQKELDYNKGFLKSVEGKLNNENFLKNAPEQVVANEKNKMADTKSKINILISKIESFQKSE